MLWKFKWGLGCLMVVQPITLSNQTQIARCDKSNSLDWTSVTLIRPACPMCELSACIWWYANAYDANAILSRSCYLFCDALQNLNVTIQNFASKEIKDVYQRYPSQGKQKFQLLFVKFNNSSASNSLKPKVWALLLLCLQSWNINFS